ncbi:hypothetical protein HanPI659440_Chr00c03g0709481 [Helianthus annuus]|nr:hypothetical protein HanPI659440_Chr00c03g0709481 [Helianthus annuus]
MCFRKCPSTPPRNHCWRAFPLTNVMISTGIAPLVLHDQLKFWDFALAPSCLDHLSLFRCGGQSPHSLRGFVEVKKTNHVLLTDFRPLVQLFSCRCLQMWSADYRPFASEKTNTT